MKRSDSYKIDLLSEEWETLLEGVRQKSATAFSRQLRLVEYSKTMPPHWCEKGHTGFVLRGRLEIEFPSGTHVFEEGDGICIPDGPEHRHRARVLTDEARVFFVEDA